MLRRNWAERCTPCFSSWSEAGSRDGGGWELEGSVSSLNIWLFFLWISSDRKWFQNFGMLRLNLWFWIRWLDGNHVPNVWVSLGHHSHWKQQNERRIWRGNGFVYLGCTCWQANLARQSQGQLNWNPKMDCYREGFDGSWARSPSFPMKVGNSLYLGSYFPEWWILCTSRVAIGSCSENQGLKSDHVYVCCHECYRPMLFRLVPICLCSSCTVKLSLVAWRYGLKLEMLQWVFVMLGAQLETTFFSIFPSSLHRGPLKYRFRLGN